MDIATLTAMGAKVDRYEYEFDASVSAEIEDGFWRKAGGRVVIGGSIDPKGDVEAQMRGFEELAKARWDETRGPAMTSLLAARQKAPEQPQTPPEAPKAPVAAPAPQSAPEPVRVPVDESGKELPKTETIEITGFRVDEVNGKRSAKIFGGHYSKFGVICWPEVMTLAGVDIDACQTGQIYKFPKDVTKAIVELKEDGKPKKVTGFA